jgi:hypothetical protein
MHVENLLSSRLLPRNVKIKIYKTVILPVGLYGCETWSLTLREEHRLRVWSGVFSLAKCNKIAIQPIAAAGSPRRFYYRLRVFENRVLRRILDLRGMKWQEVGENCIMRSCMICTLYPVLLGRSRQGGWNGRGMWLALGRWGVHTTFWLGGLKGGDHYEDLGVDGRITSRWILGQ